MLLSEFLEVFHTWYPPEHAGEWDAVGLTWGDPQQEVSRILLAVDPVHAVAEEAGRMGADLLITHHPLFLTAVHSVAADTFKGRVVHALAASGCALLTAHTNADVASGGVSEAMARALGLSELTPLLVAPGGGIGRQGSVDPMTLGAFAARVAAALPASGGGIRVAGSADRVVRRVAVLGGSGDGLLGVVAASGVDVYVTSDLKHHRAGEFLEEHDVALIDVPHWAAEALWLPVLAERIRETWGDRLAVQVSDQVTDPWDFQAGDRV